MQYELERGEAQVRSCEYDDEDDLLDSPQTHDRNTGNNQSPVKVPVKDSTAVDALFTPPSVGAPARKSVVS